MTAGNKVRLNKGDYFWIILIVLFSAVLLSFVLKGFYSRYLQDDYCYASSVFQNGFFRAQYHSYFVGDAFNGNRYSLTLFSGIIDVLGGVSLMPWFTAFWTILWGSFLVLLFKNISDAFGQNHSFLRSILFAEIVLSFSYFLAPELFQVLYWKAGSLPYLAPLVLNTYLIARIVRLSKKEIKSFHFVEFAIIGHLAAGFSENAAVIQFTLWGILILLSGFWGKSVLKNRKFFILLITVLVATLCGLLLLAFSPSNSALLSVRPAKPITVSKFLTLSFRFGLDFIYDSLKSRWLPFFVLLCSGVIFGLKSKAVFSRKVLSSLIGITLISLYLICVAASTPSVLLGSVYPENRALFPSHYFLVLSIFALGFCSAKILVSFKLFIDHERMLQIISLVLCIGTVVYMARKMPVFYDGIPQLKARAIAWDQRNEFALSEIESGKTQLIVPAFDSIARITELKEDPGNWVNACAARYYGVESVSAQEYINNVKPYFQ